MNPSILVPCDFIEESTTALLHAAHLAGKKSSGIVLLHLLFPNETKEQAETTMLIWKSKLELHFTGEIRTIVDEGDILKDIGPIAARENCEMVVMPTHGMKGIQQMMGSLALNVVTEARIPFLIVQSNSILQNGYQTMVLPIEYRRQILEEAPAILEFAKTLSSHVIGYVHNRSEEKPDPTVVSKLESLFKKDNIPFRVENCGQFDFSRATTVFAASVKADIICAINYSYENLYTINPRTDEEDLIYNSHGIPVLLITPENQDDELIHPDLD